MIEAVTEASNATKPKSQGEAECKKENHKKKKEDKDVRKNNRLRA